MAILSFQKPDKVNMIIKDATEGVFEMRPLEPGYGMTIGNSLRRVLLSSLEGYAITSVRIEGVNHEFATVKGVVEDVTNIILNLKRIRFKQQIEGLDSENAHIVITNQDSFKSGNINNFLNGFQVLNPDLEICHLEKNVRLVMDIQIRKQRGYVSAEENREDDAPIGTIFMDSIHTPIVNVKYEVEKYRVEQKTDYDKLVLTITTDGSISPENAVREAAHILMLHLALFSSEGIEVEMEFNNSSKIVYGEEDLQMRQLLKSRLYDMELSVRAVNCLKSADIETLGELVSRTKSDLLKFRNFGKKSLVELEKLVKDKNLDFGMDVSHYKLDKE
ncbi:MAG: DNA-directed RNA polymerase subunit alpha [Bacteroidales bacterium]|jgi:DNA-directed RNA polymerase subunit alpha|nr:DNA-directed RNA polymerase subunit alpha [Bacteroidales bacterium]